jgi:hypothetical protein
MPRGSSEILKEYLVSIGYQVDEESSKKAKDKTEDLGKSLMKFGKVAIAAVGALTYATTGIASRLEKLYFASQRIGASVKNIQALQYGAEQVGIGADAATASVENLAQKIRSSYGVKEFIQGFGVNPNQDKVQVFFDLIDKLQAMGPEQHPIAAQIAQQYFGIDEDTLYMIEQNRTELQKYFDQRKAMAVQAGADGDKMAKQSHSYMQSVRGIEEHVSILAELGTTKLLPMFEKLVGQLDRILNFFDSITKATDGWAATIGVVLTSLAGVIGSMKILGSLRGLLGLGGAGGGAAEGTAVAGGVGTGGIIAGGLGFGALMAGKAELEGKLIEKLTGSKVVGKGWGALSAMGGGPVSSLFYQGRQAWEMYSQIKNRTGEVASVIPVATGTGTGGTVWGNNPGNLRSWGDALRVERFRGTTSIGKFAQFATPAEGLQAMAKLLLNYQGKGLNTISSILNTYAPTSENDTGAYVSDVAKRLHVGSTQQLDLRSPGVLASLMQAMIHHEQGRDPFNAKLINDAADYRLKQASGGKSVVIQQKTEIKVNGVKDPREAGSIIKDNQDRTNADLLRNAKGVMGLY